MATRGWEERRDRTLSWKGQEDPGSPLHTALHPCPEVREAPDSHWPRKLSRWLLSITSERQSPGKTLQFHPVPFARCELSPQNPLSSIFKTNTVFTPPAITPTPNPRQQTEPSSRSTLLQFFGTAPHPHWPQSPTVAHTEPTLGVVPPSSSRCLGYRCEPPQPSSAYPALCPPDRLLSPCLETPPGGQGFTHTGCAQPRAGVACGCP